ncbi:MAG: ATP-binding protein [Oscillospiraceae bacterium]|nr:ATP-binding protein [Oscillospiraceae bacterium]
MEVRKSVRIPEKRITIVTGHYGSGKTEFSVSLTMALSALDHGYDSLAIVDLDIINPYFRSREQRKMLEDAGVGVYGSAYRDEITAELPALGAGIRAPLENKRCRVIIDAGGNDSGAIVLKQFGKYFTDDETEMLCVVNANRPDTRTVDGAIEQIEAIERVTGLKAAAIVNNTHLLRETDTETVLKGHRMCLELCERTGRYLWCDCYPEPIIGSEGLEACEYPMPLKLFMRPTWLDR